MAQTHVFGEAPQVARPRRRARLDEIGSGLTLEEFINLFLFIYLAMDGMPFSFMGKAIYRPVQIAAVLFCFTSVITFFRNRARIHWDLWTCRFGFVFLSFTVLSTTWSTAPLTVSVVPALASICTFLYYNYLIDRFRLHDFTRMMVWALTFLLIGSVIVAVLFPSVGIDDGSFATFNRGAWQGVFNQKNQLGVATAVGFAVGCGLRPRTELDRMWRWILLGLSVFCAYKSGSREAWIAIGLQMGFLVLMHILTRLAPSSRLPALLLASGGILAVGLLLYANLDAAFALIGRSRDASGRTDIWAATWLLIQRRPWFGYGMYGVWNTPLAWDVVAREGWNVTSSHNNYVEVLLCYGAVGMILYLPLIGSSFLYIFRALMNYDLRTLQVLIYVMISVLVLSFASPLVSYTPSIGMVLILYGVSHLERVERSGFMKLRD